MPIVFGAGVSYSPLLYRARAQWPALCALMVGDVSQPRSRELERGELLEDYERRIGVSLEVVARLIETARPDALVVLFADRGDVFDESNFPQLHIQVGGEVWGDPAIRALHEETRTLRFACDGRGAEILAEELVRLGFDVSEGRAAFKPLGNGGRGIGPAVTEAVQRLGAGLPIIPLHVNCHTEPTLSGARLHAFGAALARASDLTERRLGILVSGGMSGDREGPMAGWIDNVLDEWVLARLVRSQSGEIARIWGVRSRTLTGQSAEIRLWTVAAAALEGANCRARVIDYLPVHHGATGIAFVVWEPTPCL